MPGIDESLPFVSLKIAVLTVSDTRQFEDDKSGSTLVDRLTKAGHTLADRAIVMHEGRVVDQGTLRELLNDADMLHGIDLELSETAEIARVLRQHISDMPTNLLHVDELRDVIVQRYGPPQGGTHVA